MTLSARPGSWEKLKPQLARWIPLFGYYSAQRIGGSCSHLRRGKIEPPAHCEINAVDHCNLSCRDCSHASPVTPPACVDPASAHADFSRLAKGYRPRIVKVVGGEPLLHPDLPELLRALRRSGIGGRLQLVTNGLLLEQMPEAAWALLDSLEISVYPHFAPDRERLQWIKRKAAEHRITLALWDQQVFRTAHALQGTADDQLVQRIFRACRIVHTFGCQAVEQGFFYKCSMAAGIARIVPAAGLKPEHDGVRLTDAPDLLDRLLAYLTAYQPLEACRYCLGSVGKVQPHQQAPRAHWLTSHDHATEALVDYDRLAKIETQPHIVETTRRPFSLPDN